MNERVTVATISAQLDEDRAFAQRLEQSATAHAATVSKAKLHGLMVDRKETGAPGDFAGLTSREDILAAIAREFGAAVAQDMARTVPVQADEPAIAADITPRAPGDKLN